MKTMRIDRFTKTCLLAIVVLLSIFVVKPVFEPRYSYAAKSIEYKVIEFTHQAQPKEWETVLNQYGKDGWELAGFSPDNNPYRAVLKR
jgi:hypothetical protein